MPTFRTVLALFVLVLAPLAWLSPLKSVQAGNIAGNGGGLAEQNILFAWQILPDVLGLCSRSTLCTEDPEVRQSLARAITRRQESASALSFRFAEFPGQDQAIRRVGQELRIVSSRIYPEGKPWEMATAFRELYTAWTMDDQRARLALDRIVELYLGDFPQWSLSQYNHPEIRLILFSNQFFFQSYEETHHVTTLLSSSLPEILGCGGAPLTYSVSGLHIQQVKGATDPKEFAFYLESGLTWNCGGRSGEQTLYWKLPMKIDGGGFADLLELNSRDLKIFLQVDRLKFVVL